MTSQTVLTNSHRPISGAAEFDFDVAIIGAGTAGMSAYREASQYSDRVALIDGGPLGTTCARVGCMPSKLLIAAAEAAHAGSRAPIFGVRYDEPSIDGKAVMKRVRSERDRFVGFVTEAVHGFDKGEIIREYARFEEDHTLRLSSGRKISARTIVIATGSRPAIPQALFAAGERLIVNDDIFDWTDLPDSVAVFGAGVIGLELGQALHRLGVRVRLFARDGLAGPLTDPVVRQYATDTFSGEFPAILHADTQIARKGEKIAVRWGEAPDQEASFDYLVAATGRRPNIDKIGIENTSLPLGKTGVPQYDPLSGRVGNTHIFIAGDAALDLPLLHEAADEGRLAGENAARFPHSYRRSRRTPIGIVFSDPQIAMVGASHASLMARPGCHFATGEISFEDQGRARVMDVNKGILRLYAEHGSARFLGAEMIGPSAEHMAHLLAWSIQANMTVEQILQMPFYHPVLEEGVRTAFRNLNHALGFGPNPPLGCIDCGPGA
ncbi:dihydrolipoyl dehydrogenase [Parasphingorhabdus sp.]|uniref:dihydrolipoyl dehydrogenase n=1 Tax=Parasphingorhabdus sp. TaxID=2709688 RepID=UPI003A8D649D